jgi:hypothetical protein
MTASRIMYDSVHPFTGVPRGAAMIGYYINGEWAVPSVTAVQASFPKASRVPIDVIGNRADYARVADVENGDVRPGDLEMWISDFNGTNPAWKGGGRPVVYCNRDTVPAVRLGTGRYRLGRDYYLWAATLDGTLATSESLGLPAGSVVACQFHDAGDYDISMVYSAQWMP